MSLFPALVQFLHDPIMPPYTFWVEPAALSLRPTQHDAFGLLAGQRLAGTLADQVALDLGRESKGEGEHLATDVVPQAVIVFDRPHLALLVHADVEDLHNHKEVSPEAG